MILYRCFAGCIPEERRDGIKCMGTLNYARGRGYQVVELPYEGEQLSMVVFLPDDGEFEDFDDTLGAATVAEGVQSLRARLIDLSTPRFTFEWSTLCLPKTL